jgi:hypothetical protein
MMMSEQRENLRQRSATATPPGDVWPAMVSPLTPADAQFLAQADRARGPEDDRARGAADDRADGVAQAARAVVGQGGDHVDIAAAAAARETPVAFGAREGGQPFFGRGDGEGEEEEEEEAHRLSCGSA